MTELLTESPGFIVSLSRQGRNRDILASGFWLLASAFGQRRSEKQKQEARSQKDLAEQQMTELLTESAGFIVTLSRQGRNRDILASGSWLLASAF